MLCKKLLSKGTGWSYTWKYETSYILKNKKSKIVAIVNTKTQRHSKMPKGKNYQSYSCEIVPFHIRTAYNETWTLLIFNGENKTYKLHQKSKIYFMYGFLKNILHITSKSVK